MCLLPDTAAPVVTTPPEGAEVTRGERVEFYCEAVGYPMLTELVWELDGTQIPSDGPYAITSDVNQSDDGTYFRGTSRLVIASAQKAEAGRYTCIFVNALGRTTSDAAILTVLGESLSSYVCMDSPLSAINHSWLPQEYQ